MWWGKEGEKFQVNRNKAIAKRGGGEGWRGRKVT